MGKGKINAVKYVQKHQGQILEYYIIYLGTEP